MRAAEDLRRRWVELIPAIMIRVGMYASTGREMQTLADQLLGDLCFLDDRDQEYEHALGQVRSFGKLRCGRAVRGDVRVCALPGRGSSATPIRSSSQCA